MMTTKFGRIGDEVDVVERIAVDQQQVGKGAFLDDAELARIGIAQARTARGARRWSQVAIVSASAGVYQRASVASRAPCCVRQRRREQDVGAEGGLDLVLLRERVDRVGAGDDLRASSLPASSRAARTLASPSSRKGCVLSQMPFSAISWAVASSIRWPCSMHLTPAAIARWIAAGV